MNQPTCKQVLRLYKDLLRYGQQLKYTDQSFYTSWIQREFRENKSITSSKKILFGFQVIQFFTNPITCLHAVEPYPNSAAKKCSSTNEFCDMLRTICHKLLTNVTHNVRSCIVFSSKSIDYSLVPKLIESDLDARCVRGSGPGGQATNKTSNCVVLKHKPTGIIVKCHANRMMHQNMKEARRLMVCKLDDHFNGQQSVAAQEKAILERKSTETKRRKRKIEEIKKKWIERETNATNE